MTASNIRNVIKKPDGVWYDSGTERFQQKTVFGTKRKIISALQAREWFREKAKEVVRVNSKQMMKTGTTVSVPEVGKMYCFYYDAKWKHVLPYFDRFPLMFPIDISKDSMLGINLHYLPPALRVKLMDALMEILSDKKYNDNTRLEVTYGLLKSATKFKYFKPCIKKYLWSHLQSQFLYIAPDQWDYASMLPTERFTVSRGLVWHDSSLMVE